MMRPRDMPYSEQLRQEALENRRKKYDGMSNEERFVLDYTHGI